MSWLTIQNKIFLILGKPWSWKSMFMIFVCSFYKRIISNVDITLNWRSIVSEYITWVDDLAKIEFSMEKAIVFIDEWWVNLNARDSSSWENEEFAKLAIYSRKINADIWVAWQLKRMIDVYYREMSSYMFNMHAYFDEWKLMFECVQEWEYWNLLWIKTMDLIWFMDETWYSYNTLERSELEKKKKQSKFAKMDKLALWNAIAKKEEMDKEIWSDGFNPDVFME